MARGAQLALPSESIPVQLQNKATWNEARSIEEADFFTFGYMRRTIYEVIDLLMSACVTSVVDIRQYPVSMYKPEFSKNNLRRFLHEHEIGYLHLPDLGVPRDVRARAIGKHDRDDIWDWYDEYVVPDFAPKNLTWFCNALEHPVALMCMELDPTSCHRHRLALALERHGLRGFDL